MNNNILIPDNAKVLDGLGYEWTWTPVGFGHIGVEMFWTRTADPAYIADLEKAKDLTRLWVLQNDIAKLEERRLNQFHHINDRRQYEAFAPPHSSLGLVVCVQEEVGEIAEAVLGIEGEKKRNAHLTRDDLIKEIADAMTYLSLLAARYGVVDLEEMLYTRFNEVSLRANSNLTIHFNY